MRIFADYVRNLPIYGSYFRPIRGRAGNRYTGVSMLAALRSLWNEPRQAPPKAPAGRDWTLAGLFAAAALAEGILRNAVTWRPAALLLAVGLAFLLPWRRNSPLAVLAVSFLSLQGVQLAATLLGAAGWTGLYANAYVLLLPYSLFRWGSGREAAAGLAIIYVPYLLNVVLDFKGYEDAIGGLVVCAIPALLGASVRFRAKEQGRELERAKLLEREQLARELHDTVAHHVSAMVIQAQAGLAVAATRPDGVLAALRSIETAGARALGDLRDMVRALRKDEAAELAPQRGLADIRRFAGDGGGLPVEVEMSGDLDGLPPAQEAALYRMAQESITNAVRHARHASRIRVVLRGGPERIRLTVSDDGDAVPPAAGYSAGFGLAGMSERAALLGGTLMAGPAGAGGWTVEAELPRKGVPG